MGRLKPGVGLLQARAEIETVAARTVADHPEVPKDRKLAVMTIKESTLVGGCRLLRHNRGARSAEASGAVVPGRRS